MSAGGVLKSRIRVNAASMYNGLPSAKEMASYDHCCGIHGAARERKGIKRGTSAARRRHDKQIVRDELRNILQ